MKKEVYEQAELFDRAETIIKPLTALVWRQPFATAMLHGKVETRRWSTKYRGPVLIVAGKGEYSMDQLDNLFDFQVAAEEYDKICADDTFNVRGHAIAVGVLSDVRPLKRSDKTFIVYNPKLYAHVYKNVRRIKPIPISGTQGFFRITDDETLRKIEYL